MSRKAKLFAQFKRQIEGRTFRSPVYRQRAIKVMKHSLQTLSQQGHLPARLEHLNDNHVAVLLDIWAKEALQKKTLQNRLSILRLLFQLSQNPNPFPKVYFYHDPQSGKVRGQIYPLRAGSR